MDRSFFSVGAKSGLVACSAGARPNRMPVRMEIANPKRSNRASRPISRVSGIRSAGRNVSRMCVPHKAKANPRLPPKRPSSRLSVNNCLSKRMRPAPSARRTAISLLLAEARASRRFAILAQAISNTIPTTTIRITKGLWNCSRRRDIPFPPGSSPICTSRDSRDFPQRLAISAS